MSKLSKEAQAHVDQMKYKEVLNKEIAEARDYTNVDKYTGVDAHQLVKMDKQHIIEVLVHAMGTIRYLTDPIELVDINDRDGFTPHNCGTPDTRGTRGTRGTAGTCGTPGICLAFLIVA